MAGVDSFGDVEKTRGLKNACKLSMQSVPNVRIKLGAFCQDGKGK
jgi:hypothetical protein